MTEPLSAEPVDSDARPELPVEIESIKGFLDPDEGAALYALAHDAGRLGPCLEIGSYCGKSTVYLGAACRAIGATLYAVDHHRGSEEHQPGEEYHDPELVSPYDDGVDTFSVFRKTLARAGLESTVVPIVAASAVVARHWAAPLGMVFIDGGHSEAAAVADFEGWAHHLVSGGVLAIHDVFLDPAEGGQAPRHIWERARSDVRFVERPLTKTLGVFIRR